MPRGDRVGNHYRVRARSADYHKRMRTGLLAAALLAIATASVVEATPAVPRVSSSSAHYTVPTVELVRDDGKRVSLPAEMNDGRPVVLNFIFTSCSSICPLMSAILAQFQERLGAERASVHLMSISVDPEQDTPARLREYARKFHAGPQWQHYTGTVEASLAAQRAFNAWRGDKISHTPVTYVRVAPDQPWLRIDGFVTPDELLQRYHALTETATKTVAAR